MSFLQPVSDQWTDYVGNSPVADYEVNYPDSDDQRRYLGGVAETDVSGAEPETVYLHGGLIGSTTTVTDAPTSGLPTVVRRRVYTAFGELVELTGDRVTRYGYAGAWGYQEHDADGDDEADNVLMASPTEGFPFLHLGARYYDPGLGRFLQRDPIGIRGGLNVYEYVKSQPAIAVDPEGLDIWKGLDNGIDYVVNGPPLSATGAGITTGAALNYKYRLHIGRPMNRAGVVCAGIWIGWNAGKLLVNHTDIEDRIADVINTPRDPQWKRQHILIGPGSGYIYH